MSLSRGGELWDQLAFRDRLRSDPEVATSYSALKRDLAIRHRADREAYTAAKARFITAMTGARA